jgi:hypothetical protein
MIPLFGNKQNPEYKIMREQIGVQKEGNVLAASQENYAQLPMEEAKADLFKWQQDLNDELFELIMSLKGWAKINNEFKQVRETPLCNEKFIYEVVIPQCKPFMSRNLINSHFEEQRILQILRNTSNDIADAMADGWDEYGINFKDFDIVVRLIKNVMIPAPFRALKGWTKKTDNEHSKRITAFMEKPQQEKKGLFAN